MVVGGTLDRLVGRRLVVVGRVDGVAEPGVLLEQLVLGLLGLGLGGVEPTLGRIDGRLGLLDGGGGLGGVLGHRVGGAGEGGQDQDGGDRVVGASEHDGYLLAHSGASWCTVSAVRCGIPLI